LQSNSCKVAVLFNTFVAKSVCSNDDEGGRGKERALSFPSHPEQQDPGMKSPRERTNWDSLLLICGWVLCANGMEWKTKTINLAGS